MALMLYNSMSRMKEIFKPREEGYVGMYVCGPTVYGPPHLGHAKSYITFDVLAKHLRNSGYKVRYGENCCQCAVKDSCGGVFAGTLLLERADLNPVII